MTFNLGHLTLFRFNGPDSARYLSGQVTQKIEDLQPGESRHGFLCDAKGRIQFDITIARINNDYFISQDGGDRTELEARLTRYLIADDCEATDVSDDYFLHHSFSPEGPINRFGQQGEDKFIERTNEDVTFSDPKELNTHRISKGRPAFPDFLEAFPAETGLEDEFISYAKGCYLGQEVISRMKRAGKTNRQLRFIQLSGPLSAKQDDLFFYPPTSEEEADTSSKPLLKITSLDLSSSEPRPALGYLSTRYSGEFLLSPSGAKAKFIKSSNL